MNNREHHILYKIIILVSMQLLIASLELRHKSSLCEVQTQEEIDIAMQSLKQYIILGIVWSIFLAYVFYDEAGLKSSVLTTISNIIVMGYVVFPYKRQMDRCSKKNGLISPSLF